MKKYLIGFLFGALSVGSVHIALHNFSNSVPYPIAKLPSGGLYDGDMKDGVLEGRGKISWSNGDFYKGEFHNGLFHGEGRFEWFGGSYYEGEFRDGYITGKGKMVFLTGDIYEGEMLNGLSHGYGELTTDHSEYKGEFFENSFQGKGQFKDENGNTYVGTFKDNDFNGEGVYTLKDGGTYTGNFIEGEFTGQGTYERNGMHYVGTFKDWYFEGKGTLTSENGDKRIGVFEYSSLSGDGEFIGVSGEHYKGEFENGSYHGKGRLVTSEGDVFVGSFKYGSYDGEGELTYAKPVDGISKISGKWSYGTLVEPDDPSVFTSPEDSNEIALYNQNQLLDDLRQDLAEQDPNNIDMYFLGIAGDGTQGVFRRELTYIKNYFDEHLGTKDKSAALINSKRTVESAPLATKTGLKSALTSLASKMDAQNDILFIYMTSHGSDDFEFSLKQDGLKLPDLPALEFSEMISGLPVKWKVIVISACYSGGFIPALKNDNTLIITAAAEDKKSFGCSDTAEFTYFGEAFFKDALPKSLTFVEAFEKATQIVKDREESNKYSDSNPQIHKPEPILNQLASWREGLEHSLSN